MDSKKIVSILFFFFYFLLVFHESHARNLDIGFPLSSPSSSSSPAPAPGPSNEGCWFLVKSCRNGSLTACFDPSSTASKELLLLVKNDGEKPLTVKVTISHAKHINFNKEIQIPAHLIQEVNIPANLGGNSSIKLDAGNLGCVIRIGSASSSSSSSSSSSGGGIFDYMPFTTHINPINGAYLVFLTGLIIGSTCACYKLGKRGQQGDGIPYQELEMGQPAGSSPPANNVETAEGWEQDWDDDEWEDELKSKAAVGGHQMANGSSVNGLTSRSPRPENTWED